ncbi:hypothetical protein ACHHYP_20350 [Achlya hypogyna]|uniref:Uncharacterized protein n=1 Tax=Achlya hypogyna TaxID=1202772 RepID=A0A1V9YPV2_ACHHY|nr:hypothetical protein ACHHYP_20350 [Achlya hypogyna]
MPSALRRTRNSYTLRKKIEVLDGFHRAGLSVTAFHEANGIPESTLKTWLAIELSLRSLGVALSRRRRHGGGRPPSIPFSQGLLTYIKDLCRASRAVTVSRLIEFIKPEEPEWLQNYVATKAPDSLMRLLREFIYRHGFSRKRATSKKLAEDELEGEKEAFATEFWSCFSDVPSDSIPLDVGVMGVFKAKLRRLWIEDATVHNTAAHKRRATIERAIQAWDEISSSIIKSSFEKAIPRK